MSGRLIPVLNAAIFVLAAALALFAVYVAGYGSFKPSLFRGGVVLYSILLAALVLLRTALDGGNRLSIVPVLITSVLGLVACVTFSNVQIKMDEEFYFPNATEVFIGLLGILSVTELTRAAVGQFARAGRTCIHSLRLSLGSIFRGFSVTRASPSSKSSMPSGSIIRVHSAFQSRSLPGWSGCSSFSAWF